MLSFAKGERGQALELHFLGSSPAATLEAGDSAPGTVNYLTAGGSHTNLPTYQQLTYRGLWPGIDMVFAGRDGSLKYEFHLAPGADPSDIRLGYSGADGLSLSPDGALLVDTPLGALRDSSPTSYQLIDGGQVAVESRYALEGQLLRLRARQLRPKPGTGDRPRPGVLDLPGRSRHGRRPRGRRRRRGQRLRDGLHDLGRLPDHGRRLRHHAYGGVRDAFVTKLNADRHGPRLLDLPRRSSGAEFGPAIAVDAAGNAYVTGDTDVGRLPDDRRRVRHQPSTAR